MNERESMFARQAPWAPAPDGFHFEACEDNDLRWRLVTEDERDRHCRGLGNRRCDGQVVAVLNRGSKGTVRRFFYCADHLYGRWIEDGKVLHWRLVKDDPDA